VLRESCYRSCPGSFPRGAHFMIFLSERKNDTVDFKQRARSHSKYGKEEENERCVKPHCLTY
jgi:hypothetical protein